MKRIILIIALGLLVALSLLILGTIGANINFEGITLNVLNFKNLFLGMTKIVPLILFIGFIILIQRELNNKR